MYIHVYMITIVYHCNVYTYICFYIHSVKKLQNLAPLIRKLVVAVPTNSTVFTHTGRHMQPTRLRQDPLVKQARDAALPLFVFIDGYLQGCLFFLMAMGIYKHAQIIS